MAKGWATRASFRTGIQADTARYAGDRSVWSTRDSRVSLTIGARSPRGRGGASRALDYFEDRQGGRSSPDQPVSLTIDLVDGKLFGTMTPFLGGDDGATFVERGDCRQSVAGAGDGRQSHVRRQPDGVCRRRRSAGGAAAGGRGGRRAGAPLGWKEQSKIQFDVQARRRQPHRHGATCMLGDVKWLKFNYDLSKKRSRY